MIDENVCKYAKVEGAGVTGYVCRLQGGAADPERCAGCRWRKEEMSDELENRSRG